MHIRHRIASLLLVLTSSLTAGPSIAAQGVGLAWDGCLGDAGAVQNAVFACDTNTGTHTLTGSFVLGSPMAIVIGVEMVVDLESQTPILPPWWQLGNFNTCRQNSLVFQITPDPGSVCVDWAQGLSAGGIAGYCTLAPVGCGTDQPANRARLKMITAVAQEQAQDLGADQPYFAFTVRIGHAKTVGADACAGCMTPVCIVFKSANVVARGNVEQRLLTNAVVPGSNVATWQGGGGTDCPAATPVPVRNATWGAVKSLYR